MEPIGISRTNFFGGYFDGNNKAITNLEINQVGKEYSGLFGFLHYSTISNLTLKNTKIWGYYHVGGIAGLAEFSTIKNSSFQGLVNGRNNVGGIIGYGGYCNIFKCYNSGQITASESSAGGIMGLMLGGSIYQAYNIGVIHAKTCSGGIIGKAEQRYIYPCDISFSYNRGQIISTSNAAGIVGLSQGSSTYNSYNTGDIQSISGIDGICNYLSSGSGFTYVYKSYFLKGCIGSEESLFGKERTETEMKSTGMIDSLNKVIPTPMIIWEKDEQPFINEGFPVFVWQ